MFLLAAPQPCHHSPPAPRLLPPTWGWWSRDVGGILTTAVHYQGEVGQSKLMPSASLEAAKKDFEKKFREKTKNSWAVRDNFVAQPGKYTLIEVQPGAGQEVEVAVRVSVPGSWGVTTVGWSSHSTHGPLNTRTSKQVSRVEWVLGEVCSQAETARGQRFGANELRWSGRASQARTTGRHLGDISHGKRRENLPVTLLPGGQALPTEMGSPAAMHL